MTFSDAGSSRIRGCRFYWRRDVVHIGGRGSSTGNGKNPYGTEFRMAVENGVYRNVKFIKSNSRAAKTPMETMTKGRIYAVVNEQNQVKAITFYDKDNKRYMQIDVRGKAHYEKGVKLDPPHAHLGYEHFENGSRHITKRERKFVHKILAEWEKRKPKS